MKRLLFVSCLLVLGGCCTSQKASWTAIQASWEALRPYTITGINLTFELSPDARAELEAECSELSISIAQEVENAQ